MYINSPVHSKFEGIKATITLIIHPSIHSVLTLYHQTPTHANERLKKKKKKKSTDPPPFQALSGRLSTYYKPLKLIPKARNENGGAPDPRERLAMGVLGAFAVDLFRWPPSPPAVADATR